MSEEILKSLQNIGSCKERLNVAKTKELESISNLQQTIKKYNEKKQLIQIKVQSKKEILNSMKRNLKSLEDYSTRLKETKEIQERMISLLEVQRKEEEKKNKEFKKRLEDILEKHRLKFKENQAIFESFPGASERKSEKLKLESEKIELKHHILTFHDMKKQMKVKSTIQKQLEYNIIVNLSRSCLMNDKAASVNKELQKAIMEEDVKIENLKKELADLKRMKPHGIQGFKPTLSKLENKSNNIRSSIGADRLMPLTLSSTQSSTPGISQLNSENMLAKNHQLNKMDWYVSRKDESLTGLSQVPTPPKVKKTSSNFENLNVPGQTFNINSTVCQKPNLLTQNSNAKKPMQKEIQISKNLENTDASGTFSGEKCSILFPKHDDELYKRFNESQTRFFDLQKNFQQSCFNIEAKRNHSFPTMVKSANFQSLSKCPLTSRENLSCTILQSKDYSGSKEKIKTMSQNFPQDLKEKYENISYSQYTMGKAEKENTHTSMECISNQIISPNILSISSKANNLIIPSAQTSTLFKSKTADQSSYEADKDNQHTSAYIKKNINSSIQKIDISSNTERQLMKESPEGKLHKTEEPHAPTVVLQEKCVSNLISELGKKTGSTSIYFGNPHDIGNQHKINQSECEPTDKNSATSQPSQDNPHDMTNISISEGSEQIMDIDLANYNFEGMKDLSPSIGTGMVFEGFHNSFMFGGSEGETVAAERTNDFMMETNDVSSDSPKNNIAFSMF